MTESAKAENLSPGRLPTLLLEIRMLAVTSRHRFIPVFVSKNHCYHSWIIRRYLHNNHVCNRSPTQYFSSKLPGVYPDIFQIHRLRKFANA